MHDAFTIDPEFKSLLPPLSEDERTKLLNEVNAFGGCRDKLVIWREQGVLIDGHNRYEICTDLDLPFETCEMSFKGRDDVKMWMFRNQLARRNLTDFNRAEIALRMKPVVEAQAKERRKANEGRPSKDENKLGETFPPVKEPKTREVVAQIAGVSDRTINKVEKILSEATPEVIEKVRTGAKADDGKTMTVNKAYREIERTPEDDAFDNKFTTKWTELYLSFTKKARTLLEKPDANPKLIAGQLRTFIKEIE